MSHRDLAGFRTLVTGASQGLGRELAAELARRGARLCLVARNLAELEATAARCRELGAEATNVPGDLADPAFRQQLLTVLQQQWHCLDGLVNNAAVSAHGPFATADPATLRAVMELNFFAPVELVRAALPLLRLGRQPAVLNVGTALGHRGVPWNNEYCASKFALRGWGEAVRSELAGEGIDLLLASPGTIDTRFFDHLLAEQTRLPWRGRGAMPAQAAARQMIAALASGRREVFPNWRGRALVVASRFAPGVVDWTLRRIVARTP